MSSLQRSEVKFEMQCDAPAYKFLGMNFPRVEIQEHCKSQQYHKSFDTWADRSVPRTVFSMYLACAGKDFRIGVWYADSYALKGFISGHTGF
jgi:hypothetical protein